MEERRSIFSLAEALRFGFYQTIEHFGLWLTVWLTYAAVYVVAFIALLLFFGLQFIRSLMQQKEVLREPEMFLATWNMKILVGAVLLALFIVLVRSLLHLGVAKMTLDMYDRGWTDYRTLFTATHCLMRYLGATALYVIIVAIGFACLVVPGIILAVLFMFYPYAIVDKDLGVFDSLSFSARLVMSDFAQLFGAVALSWLLMFFGMCFFGVGILIVDPAMRLMYAYLYRKLSAAATTTTSS